MRKWGILIVMAIVVGRAEAGHCRRRARKAAPVVRVPTVRVPQYVPVIPNPTGPVRVIEPLPPAKGEAAFPPMATPQRRG